MNYRITAIALTLGLMPLALTLGCEKKPSEEEIIAKYEASKAEQERVAKLEDELTELKEQQSAGQQAADDLAKQRQAALERQIQDARKRAEQAEKAAEDAKKGKQNTATDNPGDNSRGERRGEKLRASVTNVPQGTRLVVSLSRELSTDTVTAGDSWEGQLTQDVTVNSTVLWRAGARVTGLVSQSAPTGRLANGEGALAIRLTEVGGSSIDGGIYLVQGDAKGGRNAKVIGTTAALGALVGVLSSRNNRNDHALGGAAIGAAVGTAVAAGTADTVLRIPASTPITFVLPAEERVVVNNR